jgi:hypothetical protein
MKQPLDLRFAAAGWKVERSTVLVQYWDCSGAKKCSRKGTKIRSIGEGEVLEGEEGGGGEGIGEREKEYEDLKI